MHATRARYLTTQRARDRGVEHDRSFSYRIRVATRARSELRASAIAKPCDAENDE